MVLFLLNVAIQFPYHTDELDPPKIRTEAKGFYGEIYAAPASDAAPEDADSFYVKTARKEIQDNHIVERVETFVQRYGLRQGKKVLDVGAGSGYLQDVVDDYVGLDISASARRYFHKPFVEASATDMPFADGEFDAVWSIWVLEHVPKPEQGLREIRRVTKNGGLLYLLPAWNCTPWAAQGYPVRPYSDFHWKGKIVKASLPFLTSPYYTAASLLPVRYLRSEYVHLFPGPTRLHYRQLEPNYKDYWMADSDAINDLDYTETLLWFTSRGDECLNCQGDGVFGSGELIIRVHK